MYTRFFLLIIGTCLLPFLLSAQKAELVPQSGHYAPIQCLAFHPSGGTLASGSEDSKVIIWDIKTGKEFRSMHQHQKSVASLLFTPDGESLISGGGRGDQSLIFWDWKKGIVKHQIRAAMSNSIEAMALSKDGRTLITGSYKELKVWDLESKTLKYEISAKGKSYVDILIKHTVESIEFSPDESFFALGVSGGTIDKQILLLNTADGSLKHTIDLNNTQSRAGALKFSPDGKIFYHAGSLGKIVFRNTRDWSIVKEIEGLGSSSSYPLSFSPEGNSIIIASPHQVNKQNLDSSPPEWNEIKTLNSNHALIFNPSGKLFALSSSSDKEEHSIFLYNAESGVLIKKMKGYPGRITSVKFSYDNQMLASGSRERPTRVWALHTPSGYTNYLEGSYSAYGDIFSTVDFSPDDQTLYNGVQGRIYLWNRANQSLQKAIMEGGKEKRHIEVSPDGKYILQNNGRVVLWDAKNGEKIKELGRPRLMTRSIAFSADGKQIFGGGFKEIKRWDTESQEELTPLIIKGYAWEMAAHPNKTHLAVIIANRLQILNAQDASVIYQSEIENEISPVYSSDGQYLASAHGDSIFIRETQTYRLLQTLVGHSDRVNTLSFSPDNTRLASGSNDTSIKIWGIPQGKLLATMMAFEEEEFIISTPDLYYMTTKTGTKGLAFRVGEQVFPFDQFDLQYNRPDKVLQSLGYASEELIQTLYRAYQKRLKRLNFNEQQFNQDFHLPNIDIKNKEIPINLSQKKLNLQLEAQDSKYALNRAQVYINDNPIYGVKGIDLKQKRTSQWKGKISLELSNGVNKIQVSVLNDKGVESLKETIVLNYEGEPSPEQLHLYALGVSKYQNPKMNLNYARKDAEDLVEVLSKPSEKVYEEVKVHTLYDEEVTKERVLALRKSLLETKVDDKVIIFIASHGLLDDKLDYFLGMHDIDFRNPAQKGLPYEELEGLLDAIPARNKSIFMDACHSGEIDRGDEVALVNLDLRDGQIRARAYGEEEKTVVESQDVSSMDLEFDIGEMQQVGLKNSFELMKELFADLRRGTGATVISSAGGLEYALEGDIWQNGVFTYCFLSALKSKAADLNQDGKIMLSEIQEYLKKEVPKLTQGKQVPTSRLENVSNDFRVW